MSPLYTITAILVTIGFVHCGIILPYPRDPDSRDVWDEDNMVEPLPNLMMFPHVYNHNRQRAKIPPHDRLKALIKAIYAYDTNHESEDVKKKFISNPLLSNKRSQLPSFSFPSEDSSTPVIKEEPVLVVDFVPNEEVESQTPSSVNIEVSTESNEDNEPTFAVPTETESPEQTTQKPEVLLEDLVDSIVHVPSIFGNDKTHKFTHSIRHGYGIPMRLSHN